MKCRTCNFEILPELKHSIAQNTCPSCGNSIMDEETLALIDDIDAAISEEVPLRPESSRKLATMLVARYDMSLTQKPIKRQQTVRQAQIAEVAEDDPDIINVSSVNGIDEKTREALFEQAIKDKFEQAGVAQTGMGAGLMDDDFVEDEHAHMADILSNLGDKQGAGGGIMSDAELDGNPRLERERLYRLAKQQQAMRSGSGAVRRSG